MLVRGSSWIVGSKSPGTFRTDADAEDGVEGGFDPLCFPFDLKGFKSFAAVFNLALLEAA